ncbi:MAG: hypothetical protein LBQ66_12470, partial [Planctomycetaceae bacterium]|nr:hypothetical protein [Planctomycetaceae bacterium]
MKRYLQSFAVIAFFAIALYVAYSQLSNFQFANLTTNNSTTCFANDANTVDSKPDSSSVTDLMNTGKFKDAYDILQKQILTPNNPENAKKIHNTEAIYNAVTCLNRLNRSGEIDELLERALEIYEDDWRIVGQIARMYSSTIGHTGYLVGDKFFRGDNVARNGIYINTEQRDRVIALRLFVQVMPLALKDENKKDAADFFIKMAEALHTYHWLPQHLTDISKIPDYPTQYQSNFYHHKAAVDEKGNPIFYNIPASFESANNDGERWRWSLEQAAKLDPQTYIRTLQKRAIFCAAFYDTDSFIAKTYARKRFSNNNINDNLTAKIKSLETLDDDETIAELANGIKYFKLPDDHNFIKLRQEIYKKTTGEEKYDDGIILARIYENRNQFTKAADIYKTMLEDFTNSPVAEKEYKLKTLRSNLSQITDNWGKFVREGSNTNALNANLRYVFRNGKRVTLSIQKIKEKVLIDEIKSDLEKSNYRTGKTNVYDRIDQHFVRILTDREGTPSEHQLKEIKETKEKYLEKEITTMNADLTPAKNHFDSAVTLNLPVKERGIYFVHAEMENGNVSNAIVWLNDTVIVKKELLNNFCWFVADAVTGEPIKNVDVQCLHYYIDHTETKLRLNTIERKTDENGIALIDLDEIFKDKRDRRSHFLMIIASDASGRFVVHGLQNIWLQDKRQYYDEYKQVKAFAITDRPVYRPNDKVELKAWISTAKYDKENINEWAEKNINYKIYDPQGKIFLEKNNVKLDDYGGMTATFNLPKKAALGSYRINFMSPIDNRHIDHGGAYFRVEEYKKPEYEVMIDSPVEPMTLGDKFNVKISAKYFFGSPVTEATVRYKVLRNRVDMSWYPVRLWDWFYGNGYSWFAY